MRLSHGGTLQLSMPETWQHLFVRKMFLTSSADKPEILVWQGCCTSLRCLYDKGAVQACTSLRCLYDKGAVCHNVCPSVRDCNFHVTAWQCRTSFSQPVMGRSILWAKSADISFSSFSSFAMSVDMSVNSANVPFSSGPTYLWITKIQSCTQPCLYSAVSRKGRLSTEVTVTGQEW